MKKPDYNNVKYFAGVHSEDIRSFLDSQFGAGLKEQYYEYDNTINWIAESFDEYGFYNCSSGHGYGYYASGD